MKYDKVFKTGNGGNDIRYTRDAGRFKTITKTIYTLNTKHGKSVQNMQGYPNGYSNSHRQQSETTPLYSLSWFGCNA